MSRPPFMASVAHRSKPLFLRLLLRHPLPPAVSRLLQGAPALGHDLSCRGLWLPTEGLLSPLVSWLAHGPPGCACLTPGTHTCLPSHVSPAGPCGP